MIRLAAIVVALGIAAAVHAQSAAAPVQQSARPGKISFYTQAGGKIFFFTQAGDSGPGLPGGTFAFERIMGGFESAVVQNAPFSAQITRETVQVLADGNRIDHKESGTIARDSSGRTRREMSLPAIGPLAAAGPVPQLVFIKDPGTGKNYVLNQNKKTAVVMNISSGGNVRAYKFARSPMGHEESAVSTESLGTKTLDGLSVQGTRTTRTIPAGKIGNQNPIVITTEKWYSPDLQMTVSFTRTDPRFGTTTYQLTNINRADPPQSLFIVPQDYTVTSGRMMMKRKFAKPAPPPPPDAF